MCCCCFLSHYVYWSAQHIGSFCHRCYHKITAVALWLLYKALVIVSPSSQLYGSPLSKELLLIATTHTSSCSITVVDLLIVVRFRVDSFSKVIIASWFSCFKTKYNMNDNCHHYWFSTTITEDDYIGWFFPWFFRWFFPWFLALIRRVDSQRWFGGLITDFNSALLLLKTYTRSLNWTVWLSFIIYWLKPMRSRTVKEPEHEEVPAPIQRKPPKRAPRGKRLKTLDLGALISFN